MKFYCRIILLSLAIGFFWTTTPIQIPKQSESSDPLQNNETYSLAKKIFSEKELIARAVNRVNKSSEGLRVHNPKYEVEFSSTAVEFKPSSNAPNFVWTTAGKDAVVPKYVDDKIVYTRDQFREEYILRANTIEQQFVVDKPFYNKKGALIISGSIQSDGVFSNDGVNWIWKNEEGQVTLSNVYVFDSNGFGIPARMEVSGNSAIIEVLEEDLRNAKFPITIDPEIGTNDFRISNFGSNGDGNQAVNAAISFNSSANRYLVVWEAGPGGDFEIYGQFLNGTSGAPEGSYFQISDMGSGSASYDAFSPDITSLGGDFFVVWRGDDNASSQVDNEFEIFGRIVTASTGVLQSLVIISQMGNLADEHNPIYGASSPAVTSNATEYLVAWSGDDNTGSLVDDEFEIYVQRVSSAGAELGSDIRISDMGPDGFPTLTAVEPDIAWNSTNNTYLATWYGDDVVVPLVNDELEIFMQQLTSSGNPTGANDVRVSFMGPNGNTSYVVANPSIAYNSVDNNYLIVWQGEHNVGGVDGKDQIYGSSVSNLGVLGTMSRFSDLDADGDVNSDALNSSVQHDNYLNQFLVTWHGDDNSGALLDNEFEIYGQLVSGTGTEIGIDIRLSDVGGIGSTARNGKRSSSAYNSAAKEYIVIWEADDSDGGSGILSNEFEIFGQRFAEMKAEPTLPPTGFGFNSITPSSFTVSFTAAGSVPDDYIALRKATVAVSNIPADQAGYQVNNIIGGDSVVFQGTGLTFTQSGLNPGTTFNYRIFSHNGVNSSSNYLTSSYLSGSVTTYAVEPTAHAALFTAAQAGANQINLTFSAASSVNGNGYIILRRQDGTNPTASGITDGATASSTPVAGTTVVATITDASALSYNDASASPGILYNYAIIPYGYKYSNALTYNFRTSATIPTANATTLSLEPAAHAGTFTAVSSGTSQVNLSFSAASTLTNAAGYIILRKQDGTNPTTTGVNDGAATAGIPVVGTTLVTTISSTATTTFNDTGVSPGTQYNYAIIPYGYNGSSALSYNYRTAATIPVANATTLSLEPLAHPASFAAVTGGSNQINLIFSAASTITNAAGFIILRRQDLSNPSTAGIADATATPAIPVVGTTLVTTITSTATTFFNDATVSPGIQYNYTIFPYGYNGSNALTYNYLLTTGMSANAFTLSAEPSGHAVSFTAIQAGTAQINLAFSAASSIANAAGYIILHRQDGTNPSATGVIDGTVTAGTPVAGTTLVTTITSTATIAFSDAVSPGIQYNYAIIPYGFNGSNTPTYNYRTAATIPVANATTLSLEPLAHPALFAAATGGSNQINLTFSAASTITNAEGYIILRRQDLSNPTNAGIVDATTTPAIPTSGTTLVTTITSTATTSFNDVTVSPGIQYNYTIFPYGYNGSNALTYNYLLTTGMSANAFTLSAEPIAHAASFTATQAGTNQINLTFAAANTIANASGYIILRRSDGTDPTTAGVNDGAATSATPVAGTSLITTITGTATTSFNDTGVSPGLRYNYTIIPYGYNGSNTQTYNYRTAITLPTTNAFTLSLEPAGYPVLFTATQAGTSQVNLTFSAAGSIVNAAGYIILRRSDGANPTGAGITDGGIASGTPAVGTTLVTTIASISTTSFNDTGLSSGIQYNYAIIPYGYNGINPETYNYRTAATIPTANATTVVVEPSFQPTGMNFTSLGNTSFTVNFTAASGGAVGYIAFRKMGSSPSTAIPVDGTTYTVGTNLGDGYIAYIGSGTSFPESGLSINTIYFYDIFAFNGTGVTINYLATAPLENSRTTLQTEPANQPTAISFSAITSYSYSVSFAAATGSPEGYIVLRTIGSFPPDVPVDGTTYSVGDLIGTGQIVSNGPAITFNEITLASNTAYFYRVYSYNGIGPAINYLTGAPLQGSQLTPPDAPVAKDPIPTSSSFKAKWDPIAGATSYQIDVSKDGFVTFLTGYNSKSIAASSVPEELVNGLTPLTSYKYRVRSVNSGGVSANSNEVSVLIPVEGGVSKPLDIPVTNNPSFNKVFAGTSVTVKVEVNDGIAPVNVVMRHRKITSAGAFENKPASFKSGSTYEVSVSSDMLDELGIEFYFEASDASGGLPKTSDPHSFIYNSIESASIPFTSAFDGTTGTYQMFSVPYEINLNSVVSVFDELGKYEKTQWRLFHYQSGKYAENEDGLNNIELGKGYWFNAKEKVEIKSGAGVVAEANQSKAFSMTLSPGWNQIGNPFQFNINWTTIKDANQAAGLNSLWLFEGGTYIKKDVLATWKGAFVFSDNGGTVNFSVSAKTPSAGRTKSSELNPDLDEMAWQFPLTLNLNGLEQVSAIGMHPEAKTSKDKFDEITIPRFLDYLEMNTYHEEFFAHNFKYDVIPSTNSGSWLFTVSSNQKEGEAILSWDQQALLNSESKLVLLDLQGQTPVDMKTTSNYRFSWTEGRQFKILYGKEGELLPEVTLLGNAYPNPFTTAVTIPFLLDRDLANVEVDLYDLLGRRVKTMRKENVKEGIRQFEWNGSNDQGYTVESGVYLYQLKGEGKILSSPKRLLKQ